MSLIFTLKILADLCFYFTFAGFFATLFGSSPAVFALPVLVSVTFSCAILTDNKRLRYLPLVILPVCFLSVMPLTVAGFLLVLPPMAYVAYSAVGLDGFTGQFNYDGIFSLYLKIFFPFLIAAAVFARPQLESSSLPFALTFLASSVALMRMLRHEPAVLEQTRFKLLNLLSMFFVVASGLLVSSKFFLDMCKTLLIALYQNVLAPILTILFSALMFVIYPIFSMVEKLPEQDFNMPTMDMNQGANDVLEETVYNPNASVSYRVLRAVLILAFLVLAVYFVIRLFRALSTRQMRMNRLEGITEQYTAIGATGKPARTRTRSTVRQVREYYRRFLIVCAQAGIKKEPYMTSADFQRLSTTRFQKPEEAAGLRELYIETRYGEKTPTREDIRKAKELYGKFRKSKPL